MLRPNSTLNFGALDAGHRKGEDEMMETSVHLPPRKNDVDDPTQDEHTDARPKSAAKQLSRKYPVIGIRAESCRDADFIVGV